MDNLAVFKNEPIDFVEEIHIKAGVVCHVYAFRDNNLKDLAIVAIEPNNTGPKQRVLSGTKTVIGYVSGEGTLSVNEKTYTFPNEDFNDLEVKIGDVMFWQTKNGLIFFEEYTPPYQSGRYEDLD